MGPGSQNPVASPWCRRRPPACGGCRRRSGQRVGQAGGGELGADRVAGRAAGQAGDHDVLAQRVQDPGDVDALAAGPRTDAVDAVRGVPLDAVDVVGDVERRVQRDGEDHPAEDSTPASRSDEHDRPGEVARAVRVQSAGLGERDRGALGEHERGQRVELRARPRRAGPRELLRRRRRAARATRPRATARRWRSARGGTRTPGRPPSTPGRSRAASAPPRAPARPSQPRPRNVHCSTSAGATGSGAASARSRPPRRRRARRVDARAQQRQRAGGEPGLHDRRLVGERESTRRRPPPPPAARSAVSATLRAASRRRERALDLGRRARARDRHQHVVAAPAAARTPGTRPSPPAPAASRSAAHAWATYSDVPQPTTQTRSPGGRQHVRDLARQRAGARATGAGWDAISSGSRCSFLNA